MEGAVDSMIISMDSNDLKEYVLKSIDTFFPDGAGVYGDDVDEAFCLALERTENCFSHIILPGYNDENGNVLFSHLHTDQYATFLYFFMNSLYKISQNKSLCSKIMYLNRILHGFFVSYKCSLLDIFALQHPVGTVIGNADYNDFLVILQNVTINTGEDANGKLSPKLGKALFCGAGSKIIGNKTIGNRVSIGVDATIYNQVIGDDMVAQRKSGGLVITRRKNSDCAAQKYFKDDLGEIR